MEIVDLIPMITAIIAFILGIIAKRVTWIDNKLIPLQNLIVGIVITIIEWIATGDFSVAILTSGLFAGGMYDLGHNVLKLMEKGDE